MINYNRFNIIYYLFFVIHKQQSVSKRAQESFGKNTNNNSPTQRIGRGSSRYILKRFFKNLQINISLSKEGCESCLCSSHSYSIKLGQTTNGCKRSGPVFDHTPYRSSSLHRRQILVDKDRTGTSWRLQVVLDPTDQLRGTYWNTRHQGSMVCRHRWFDL